MSTTLPIFDKSGSQIGGLDLSPAWLEREKGDQAVHDSVVACLAGMRAGTASTKTRGKVRGGGAKPWRQKGTGRARAGSNRSPVWRGGGIIFGPIPRSFAKHVNRKVEKLAMRRVFTERLDENAVIVVDDVVLDTPKTKGLTALLKTLGAGVDALVLVDKVEDNVRLAAQNLPSVRLMTAVTVNPYWMLLYKKIVVTRAALEVLGGRIGAREKAE
ncbi:MAG: 50S ribosomal protein L4 [Lentisphaerae bacterium RIFOXYB12_FULL_65_16]|nr:MAG: 50S ribosomal protein L4 [Lentisphaerae bacterium RIFOXYA12_64_32]OGV93944.1 MAG: 50S ribosomal protein L4 [Lentisphaerae bacterium RIFOXYB12_FULL_65_16]